MPLPPDARRVLQLEALVRRSAGPAWAPPPGEAWIDEDGAGSAAAAACANALGAGGSCAGRAGGCAYAGSLAGAFADTVGPPAPEPLAPAAGAAMCDRRG